MNDGMRIILKTALRLISRAILLKYRPQIVAVTGSVGKTSVKDAVFCVLLGHFSVFASAHNLNTEFGVPASIIGGDSVGLSLLLRALWLLCVRDASYPRILVLEFGADKPGDIEYLVRLAPPHVALLTAIAPAHLAGFATIAAVEKEKKMIYSALGKNDWFVGDADAGPTLPDAASPARGMMFSRQGKSARIAEGLVLDAVWERLVWSGGRHSIGVSFHARYQGQEAFFEMRNCIGDQYATIAGYAIGVGLVFGMPLEAISHSLARYASPNGRLRPIEGVRDTLIIDDTYNSSPNAVVLALDILLRFECAPSARRWAILGDMFELGEESERLHAEAGAYAGKKAIDFLVCVGGRARVIAAEAAAAGLDESRIFLFDDPIVAGRAVKEKIAKGDIILVKGSQGIRLEKCVKELMAEPDHAGELLVRQSKQWV